jgi:PPIC-type PPIASE domain
VSDEDVKKYYDQHKAQLKSPEMRRIKLASFVLNDEQKKLDTEKKNAELKNLAGQAEAFAQAVLDHPDQLNAVAKDKNIQVQQTGLFAASSSDPLLKTDPALSPASASLRKDAPVSDVVQGENGFYVLELADSEPSKPLTLDEAKSQITTTLKAERTRAAMEAKAKQVREKIATEIKAGRSFAEAAAVPGYKAEQPAPFSLQDPGQNNSLSQVIYLNQLDLEPGEISKLVQDGNDGLLVYLEKKDPIDESKYQEDARRMAPIADGQFADMVFEEWLKVQQQRLGRPPV